MNWIKTIFFIVFPITSFLVIPSVQGTTPAYLICFAFLFVVFLSKRISKVYYFYLLILLLNMVFLLNTFLGQISVFIGVPNIQDFNLYLVTESLGNVVFLRPTIFTQHIYLFVSIIAFAFVTFFYKKGDIERMYWGIRFLIFYGLLEIIVYSFSSQRFDFISNRSFSGEEGTGSLFQTFTVGSLSFQRFKSLTGEPSMFAFTVLPFWCLAIENKRKMDTWLCSISLLLTFSTSAFLGMFIYCLLKLFSSSLKTKLLVFISFIFVPSFLILFFQDHLFFIWDSLFLSKFSGESTSGQERSDGMANSFDFWWSSSFFTKLFGVGFGVIRSTDFFSTILVNLGVIGHIIWFLLFFSPFLFADKVKNRSAMNVLFPSVLVIYIIMMISVPEYSYLSIWLILGIVYHEFISNVRMSKINSY